MNEPARRPHATRAPTLPEAIEIAVASIDRSRTGLGVSGTLVQDLGRFVYQHSASIVAALKASEAHALAFPIRWSLSQGQAAVLRALLERPSLTASEIREINGTPAEPRRVIFDIRAKLAEHVGGVPIGVVHWRGYFMEPKAKARLREAIAASSLGEEVGR